MLALNAGNFICIFAFRVDFAFDQVYANCKNFTQVK